MAMPIPRTGAITSRVWPAFANRSVALARAVGARTLYLPAAAVLALRRAALIGTNDG